MKPFNKSYSNNDITVFFQPRLCIHATVCLRELPKVFNLGMNPWVNMEGATTEEIIGCVERCPTDALTYEFINKENVMNVAKKETLVTMTKDGPLVIHEDCKVIDNQGKETIKKGRVAICMCGLSENKPFCDGKHIRLLNK
jgi:uncharacterized Fe-S cluster protein YjdI/CDGSH-type Zn-finger protein